MRNSPLLLASILSLLLVVGATPCRVRADEEPADKREEQVAALVHAAGVGADTPGIGVLVVTPKGVQLKKGWGLANLATHAPIEPSTTFELASVSKQMTGSAVLLLVQRGKVKIDEDVRTYLPTLPAYDEHHPITVDHLSRHTSGLPDYLAWEGGAKPASGYWTNADILAEFGRRKESSPLVSTPGAKYEYSNSGYMLLGSIVEKVSGLSFGAFLKKEFFEPLGMKTAWVHESPRVPTAEVATGYTHEGDAWKPTWAAPTAEKHETMFATGDGSVWASLDDMVGWDRGLRTGSPVKAETMLPALAPGKTNSGETVAYAMGWNVEPDDHGAVANLYHSGKWGGFENFLSHDVAHGITVLVLSNRGGLDAGELAHAIAALYRE